MSDQSNDSDVEQSDPDTAKGEEAVGVEIGNTDGGGSTFEPEEDPEGHAG